MQRKQFVKTKLAVIKKKISISTQSSIPGPAGSAVEAANSLSFLKRIEEK